MTDKPHNDQTAAGQQDGIVLVPELPSKPKFKEPCNGCGLCCAIEVCHAGKLVFGDIEGPCPALAMSRDRTRVVCSFVEVEIESGLEPILQRSLGIGLGCSMED